MALLQRRSRLFFDPLAAAPHSSDRSPALRTGESMTTLFRAGVPLPPRSCRYVRRRAVASPARCRRLARGPHDSGIVVRGRPCHHFAVLPVPGVHYLTDTITPTLPWS
jgi:hypothetical protein